MIPFTESQQKSWSQTTFSGCQQPSFGGGVMERTDSPKPVGFLNPRSNSQAPRPEKRRLHQPEAPLEHAGNEVQASMKGR